MLIIEIGSVLKLFASLSNALYITLRMEERTPLANYLNEFFWAFVYFFFNCHIWTNFTAPSLDPNCAEHIEHIDNQTIQTIYPLLYLGSSLINEPDADAKPKQIFRMGNIIMQKLLNHPLNIFLGKNKFKIILSSLAYTIFL